MTLNQSHFKLHGPPLANTNLNKFQLFHDAKLEVIESHMTLNVEGSGDATNEEDLVG
jgi:hypothetical protein